MDGYYVVRIIALPYPIFGLIIDVILKEANLGTTPTKLAIFPQCTCLDFAKVSIHALGGKEMEWVYCKHMYISYIVVLSQI